MSQIVCRCLYMYRRYLMTMLLTMKAVEHRESIFNNEIEIGKVLIDNDYPFALIKYLDDNFDEKVNFKTKEATIKIKKPNWIN